MANRIYNKITLIDVTEEQAKEIFENIEKGGRCGTIDFETIIPMPDDIYRGPLGEEEYKIYGKKNWYDWSRDNWGTQWNAFKFPKTDDPFSIIFTTAWDHPWPIIEELSRTNPGVLFGVSYVDEMTPGRGRWYAMLDGEIITDHDVRPDKGSDQVELYTEYWNAEDLA